MDKPPPPPDRRRMHGPRTWALARELYLAGATAAEVEAKLGVRVGALRQRACREGWTKTALGDADLRGGGAAGSAVDPPSSPPAPCDRLDPSAIAHAGARRAAQALTAGRGAEALALAKASEQVLELIEALPPDPADAETASQARAEDLVARLEREWSTAVRLAEALLKDGGVPAVHMRAALRWRAANLGEEVAEADRAAALARSRPCRHYDAHGALRPPVSVADFLQGQRD